MQDYYYWIALRFICGIGNVNYKNLINHFGDPEKIFHADHKDLGAVEGINKKAIDAILHFKPIPQIDRELDRAAAKGIRIIPFTSSEYPENLKNIYDPPPFLYVNGTFEKQDGNAIAVVGSRYASEYGMKATQRITCDLTSCGITIISGMARGIDSCAHREALAGGGRTIAVLGSGVDVVYPPENRELYKRITAQGAVISEYPMGTKPNSYNFPGRNRIISALSLGVLVAEASQKSGSLITARYALEQGREVFATPGNIYSYKSRGTNDLLKRGAKVVQTAEDILEELQFPVEKRNNMDYNCRKNREELGLEEQKLYELIEEESVHIDELMLKSGLSSGQLSSILLDLELKDLIQHLPGKRFVRCS